MYPVYEEQATLEYQMLETYNEHVNATDSRATLLLEDKLFATAQGYQETTITVHEGKLSNLCSTQ